MSWVYFLIVTNDEQVVLGHVVTSFVFGHRVNIIELDWNVYVQ